MTTIVYRPRGSAVWTHRFVVHTSSWRAFYRHARRERAVAEYARVTPSGYVPVLS